MIDPTHTIFLLVVSMMIGGVFWCAVVQIALNRITLPNKRAWQIGSTLFIGGVGLLALSFSLSGRYTNQNVNSAGLIPLLITVMIATNVTLLFISSAYRQLVDNIPLHWLIGSNVLRIVPGVILLAFSDMRLLPPAMSLEAGYGDILSGLLAIPVAYFIYWKTSYARRVAVAWSIFGLLDLVNALYLGQTTIPAWTQALAQTGQPIDYVNLFLMLPTYGVPLFLVAHIWIFRRLFLLKGKAAITHPSMKPETNPG
jgi:hypothetical protein